MQVWIVLHAARWKCRTQKIAKNSPYGHHRTTLSGSIFTVKAHIDNWKKLGHMSLQYGELWPTSGWDRFISLGHLSKFQRVSRFGSVTARHSSGGRPPNFAALSRGRHRYLEGWPSRWALAHILVHCCIFTVLNFFYLLNDKTAYIVAVMEIASSCRVATRSWSLWTSMLLLAFV